jgi:hypothetical protein
MMMRKMTPMPRVAKATVMATIVLNILLTKTIFAIVDATALATSAKAIR